MRFADVFGPLLDLPHRHRRVWRRAERTHIELREIDDERVPAFVEEVETRVAAHSGVRWAEVHGHVGRLVVSHRPDVDTDALVALVDAAEEACGVDDAPFGVDRPDHPADVEPLIRSVVALGADVAGLGLALTGRFQRWRPLPVEIDTAALLAVVDNVPALRARVEHRLTTPVAELGLAVANGIAAGLAQGATGPLIDIVHRASQLTEAEARRRVWDRRESDLCDSPSGVPAVSLRPHQRPAPLADGPVEQYSTRALPASLGGFGVGLALTRSVDRAAAALLAGLPKAARLGREAFAAQVGRLLAARDVLVIDPDVLRRLDRMDHLVLDLASFGADHPFAEEGLSADTLTALVAAADRAGLVVHLTGVSDTEAEALGADRCLPDGPEGLAVVRDLQAEGHGVVVAAAAGSHLLEVGDCGVGWRRPGAPPPWEADLVVRDDPADLWLVIEACGVAHTVSRQSANLAFFGASAGVFLAFGGFVPGTTQRVTTAVNAATALAMVNGFRAGADLSRRRIPAPRVETPWHELDAAAVLERLESGPAGLAEALVAARVVEPAPPTPGIVRFGQAVADELLNPLTPVLAVGAGLSLAVGSVTDAVLVGSVVALNAVVGGVQRFRTDQAIDALSQREERMVRVVRAGHTRTVPSHEVVVGDLVLLEAGEWVPADCRLLDATGLQADESSLTGESLPVAKQVEPVAADSVADRTSMLYEGTSVAAGEGRAVVVAVGEDTESARGLSMVADGPPPTGVEARLSELTRRLTPVSVAGGLSVLGAGLLRGRPLSETAGAGVSLAVAAVPEGLPLLATIAQTSAAHRLSARGALVRNPRAIEALGRVEVLCADKTGTLTEGRIRIAEVLAVEGESTPLGSLTEGEHLRERAVVAAALRATPTADGGRKLPHPTDRALIHAAEDLGLEPTAGATGWRWEAELPFEPARAYHANLAATSRGRRLSVKGAPEVVLPACTKVAVGRATRALTPNRRTAIDEEVEALARRGLRVLAVAERTVSADELRARRATGSSGDGSGTELDEALVDGLRLVGFVAMRDPVRVTARDAVAGARAAGLRVVMITGDHPSTAEGVAVELGLLDGGSVLTGAEIDALDDRQLADRMGDVSVCARVTPAHKVRIVRAFQRQGVAVAMTGDGANDAPAIRLADVGIALGSRATTAARQAADVVVVDDRIETIVDAIAEGRTMWSSVREAVAVLVGGNLGEVAFTVGGSLLSGSPPLNARQLLLVNLLTDSAPALAIAMRPPSDHTVEALMREGPDRSLGEALNRAIAVRAVATATGAGVAWGLGRVSGTRGRASTIGLVALVGAQLGQTLTSGGTSPAVLAAGLGSAAVLAGIVQTPGVSQLFGCRPLGPVGWAVALSAAGAATAGSVVLPDVLERTGFGWFDRLPLVPLPEDDSDEPGAGAAAGVGGLRALPAAGTGSAPSTTGRAGGRPSAGG